jgi:Zn-dependent oligopeptidase
MNITFSITNKKLYEITKNTINKSNILYNNISKLKDNQINYNNIINKLQDNDAKLECINNMTQFLENVSPNIKIRSASTNCHHKLYNHYLDILNRSDVFNIINTYYNKIKNDVSFKKNNPIDYRYICYLIRSYKRNGVHLDKNKKNKLLKVNKKIKILESSFSNNINNDNTKLYFNKNELDGLNNDFIKKLPYKIKKKNKYIDITLSEEEQHTINNNKNIFYEVSLEYPIYNTCIKYINDENIRKKLHSTFNNRCKNKNTKILIDLIKLRNEKSQLLGYKNHMEYVTEILVSKNCNNIHKFINELLHHTNDNLLNDIKTLEKIKKNKINDWDLKFYEEKLINKYNVDSSKLQEYFPLNHVIDQTLKIYQNILNLIFVKFNDKNIWHPSVLAFKVYDTNGTFIGTFYLDLFPRPNKYTHAACFQIIPACELSTGKKIKPISSIVANFTKPTDNKPSLLNYYEVIVFFHEFGHVMHQLLGHTKFSLFSGSSTETDFVEAPSQMFEYWCWEKNSIKKLSKHYITGKPLDDKIIENLIKTKKIIKSIKIRRQIYLTTFDMLIHSDQNIINNATEQSLYKLLKKIKYDITKIPLTENTFFPASFGHLASGYDGQYYSYLWSAMYAANMYYLKFKNNIFNKDIGISYRKNILEKGSTINGSNLIYNFINRKPSINYYIKLEL